MANPESDRTSIERAYGRYGDARSDVDAWRTEPTGFERTVPDSARRPINARRSWLRRLNGWLQIGIFAAAGALVFGAGFVAGAVWAT